jgi:putative chitinase
MNQNFYTTIRSKLFAGELSQHQVDGMEAIALACNRHAITDVTQVAYVLATAYHEAGKGMYPVREGFSATNADAVKYVTALYNRRQISINYALPDGLTGQCYYGRGIVQLTWKGNYEAFGRLLKIDLLNNPDLALKPQISAEIAALGMKTGAFTGKKLSDYFNDNLHDPVNARRIINGTDRASTVATYFNKFYSALKA